MGGWGGLKPPKPHPLRGPCIHEKKIDCGAETGVDPRLSKKALLVPLRHLPVD